MLLAGSDVHLESPLFRAQLVLAVDVGVSVVVAEVVGQGHPALSLEEIRTNVEG